MRWPRWRRTEVVWSSPCVSKSNACRRDRCSSFQKLQLSGGFRSTSLQNCLGKFQRLAVVVRMWPSRGSPGTLRIPYVGRVYNFFTSLVPGVMRSRGLAEVWEVESFLHPASCKCFQPSTFLPQELPFPFSLLRRRRV